MRKLLFVVVLVAASFAGGAAVHSRGPRWAQTLIQNQLGVGEAGAPAGEVAPAVGDTSMVGEIPSSPLPPLVVEPAPLKTPPKKAPAPPTTVAAATRPEAPAPPESKAPEPLDPGALGLGGGSADAKPPTPLAEAPAPPLVPSTLSPSESPPILEAPASLLTSKDRDSKSQDPKPVDPPRADASPPRAQQEPTAEPPSPAPAVPAPEPPTPGAGSRPPASWAEIRRSMRELGVSRYGIEGEPGGRVRFHCLIPLAGRRAVAQQFEAEDDDEFQAAEAALRRVALWRATENPAP